MQQWRAIKHDRKLDDVYQQCQHIGDKSYPICLSITLHATYRVIYVCRIYIIKKYRVIDKHIG